MRGGPNDVFAAGPCTNQNLNGDKMGTRPGSPEVRFPGRDSRPDLEMDQVLHQCLQHGLPQRGRRGLPGGPRQSRTSRE